MWNTFWHCFSRTSKDLLPRFSISKNILFWIQIIRSSRWKWTRYIQDFQVPTKLKKLKTDIRFSFWWKDVQKKLFNDASHCAFLSATIISGSKKMKVFDDAGNCADTSLTQPVLQCLKAATAPELFLNHLVLTKCNQMQNQGNWRSWLINSSKLLSHFSCFVASLRSFLAYFLQAYTKLQISGMKPTLQ